MRVSVVIPCYNSLRFLPETLDSVLAQTWEDLEVVLVDDGGTDDLAGWLAGRPDPRVRVVRQDNAGVSAARNRGVAESHGELIAFLDSDDVWEPVAVERMVACFDRDPDLGLAYGGYDVVDAEGRRNGRVVLSSWEGDVWERFVTRNPVAMSASMAPRAVLDELGGFVVNRDRFPVDVEDWELWIRIAAHRRVAVVREVLVHHRRHGANSSSDPDSLEAAYRHLLEVVFADVDGERGRLRGPATAHAELVLGWHALHDVRDPRRALAYRRSARRHAPAVRRAPEYWRLGAAAGALRLTGERGWRAVRSLNAAVRRGLGALPLHRLRRETPFSP